MKAVQVIHCRGDAAVRSRHPTTFAITTDRHLTPAGDCIIGICADMGASGLSAAFRDIALEEGSTLLTRLTCGNQTVIVRAEGGSGLCLDHPYDMVWRKSSYTCGRTIGIRADHAARDLPEEMVSLLRLGNVLVVEITALSPGDEAF